MVGTVEVICRSYNDCNEITFKKELKSLLRYNGVTSFNSFESVVLQALNKHAPCEKKILRANHIPNMTKALSKAIMRRYQIQNKYFKEKLLKMIKSIKNEGIHTAGLMKTKGGNTVAI